MTVQIRESQMLDLECDECEWSPLPFNSRSAAEKAAQEHEDAHAGVYAEGEDA